MTAVPYRYEVTHTTAEVRGRWGRLDPGVETDDVVVVAGRLVLRRVQGKLAFATLQDGGGRLQLFARAAVTPDFDGWCGLSLGDWVGVRGRVLVTRRGELSVSVDEWVVLAPTRRPFPDKWHGVTDVDNQGLAFNLAQYHTWFGDWRELFRYLDRIDAVTKEDIRRVASETLVAANRTVGMVVTETPDDEPAAEAAASAGR